MNRKLLLVSSLIALCAVPVAARQFQAASQDATATAPPTRYGAWGVDLAGMDPTIKPGDDWFDYVNGAWVKKTQIPADRSSYGAFAVLRDLSEVRLRKLVEGYKSGDTLNPDRAKLATFYGSFMDEAAIERRRRPGNRGQAAADQATGTGLGDDDTLPAFPADRYDLPGQRDEIIGKHRHPPAEPRWRWPGRLSPPLAR